MSPFSPKSLLRKLKSASAERPQLNVAPPLGPQDRRRVPNGSTQDPATKPLLQTLPGALISVHEGRTTSPAQLEVTPHANVQRHATNGPNTADPDSSDESPSPNLLVRKVTTPSEDINDAASGASLLRGVSDRSEVTTAGKPSTPGYIPEFDGEEDLAAQQRDYQQSLQSNDFCPRQVDCRLMLFLDRKGPYEYYEDVKIVWQKQYNSRFKQIDDGAKNWLIDKYSKSDHSLYRIAGTCKLFRVDLGESGHREVEVDSHILEKEGQWSIVLRQMLLKFFFDNRNHGKRCKVELRWEYASLLIKRVEGKPYAPVVQEAVRHKMQRNWQQQLYLPRGDDKHIFTETTVGFLLDDDESLKADSRYRVELSRHAIPFDLENFKLEVWGHGHRLLAVCVYLGIPLECLHRLMREGLKNSSLPITEFSTDWQKLKNSIGLVKCDDFLQHQGKFIPHSFARNDGPPEHRFIDDNIVVPIWFDNRDKARLGHGTFGEVFEATIWPGHHVFSTDRDEKFAIKRWKWWDSEAEAIFKKEEIPLQKLHSTKCGNVVLHYASWSQGTPQGRRFYMLFPLARFNLATFLKEPTPIQDKAHVTWLFQQLFDLTDAVDQVHTLAPLESDQPNGNAGDQLPPRKTGGFHHDLKPANILAFYDAEESRPVLKITDFGIAKLDIVLERSRSQGQGQGSYRSQHFAGDPIYGAPDFSQNNEAGRKADIWSLGCCFLEILLWNFGYGGTALEDFFQARYKQPPGSRGTTAAYWYYDQNLKTVALKPAVTEKLKELQRICFQKGQFQTLIRQIEFMLTIKPDERRPASVFRSAFKAMLQQAQVDLTEDADFYQRPGYVDSSRTTFAPVTEEYITSSRRNSIDDRQVNAPFGPPASPITTSQQHYRSLSNSSDTSKYLQVNTHDSANYGGQFHLSPKGESPDRGRSRTPSIEISDYTFSNGHGDQGPAIIGALHGPPNREEIPVVRPRTPSVKSKTL